MKKILMFSFGVALLVGCSNNNAEMEKEIVDLKARVTQLEEQNKKLVTFIEAASGRSIDDSMQELVDARERAYRTQAMVLVRNTITAIAVLESELNGREALIEKVDGKSCTDAVLENGVDELPDHVKSCQIQYEPDTKALVVTATTQSGYKAELTYE